jgi:hypothetical protein
MDSKIMNNLFFIFILLTPLMLFSQQKSRFRIGSIDSASIDFQSEKIQQEIKKRRRSYPLTLSITEEVVHPNGIAEEPDDLYISAWNFSSSNTEKTSNYPKNPIRQKSTHNLWAGLTEKDKAIIEAQQAAYDAAYPDTPPATLTHQNKTPTSKLKSKP